MLTLIYPPDPITIASQDATTSEPQCLTDTEVAERDRLVEEAHTAQSRGHRASVEFGRHLREIRDRRLYREGGRTWEAFMDEEFELSGERGRQLIGLADLHDTLTDAGVEPVLKESHARSVLALPHIALQVEAVQRGREIAEVEGTRLYARHLEAAILEIATATTSASDDVPAANAAREAVHARGGLHVVLPRDETQSSDATPYLPGRVIAPWEGEESLTTSGAGRRGLTRADLDEAAELVWPVLGPDPWTSAVEWVAPTGPLTATLFPERLGAPTTSPSPEDNGRARTVLVAPGIDVLHPEMSVEVTREVIEAASADPARLYVFLTNHPQRSAQFEWPKNAAVCLFAHNVASAEAASIAVASVLDDVVEDSAVGSAPRFVLLLRDCTEPIAPEVLRPFVWVLLRGKRTKQAAYDSVLRAVPMDHVHVGREVRTNLKGNPLLAPIPAAPHPVRRAVPVVAVGDRTKGPLRPPVRRP